MKTTSINTLLLHLRISLAHFLRLRLRTKLSWKRERRGGRRGRGIGELGKAPTLPPVTSPTLPSHQLSLSLSYLLPRSHPFLFAPPILARMIP
jgi:hypothetical protein